MPDASGLTIETACHAFFDREAVLRAIEPRTRRLLSRFGAYTRQKARGLIRTHKGASKPGSPPYSHTGLLKKFIFFAADVQAKSVVVGPVKLDSKRGEAPRILEHGGATTIYAGRKKTAKKVTIQKRPYMKPAFDAELAKMPGWAGNV